MSANYALNYTIRTNITKQSHPAFLQEMAKMTFSEYLMSQ